VQKFGQFLVHGDTLKIYWPIKLSSHIKFRWCLNNHIQSSVSKDKTTISRIHFRPDIRLSWRNYHCQWWSLETWSRARDVSRDPFFQVSVSNVSQVSSRSQRIAVSVSSS